MLDDLKDFVEALRTNANVFAGSLVRVRDLYCPPCGGPRRMDIGVRYQPLGNVTAQFVELRLTTAGAEVITPSLFTLRCGQCGNVFTAVIYPGPDGPSLAILGSTRGGLTTPNTPPAVAYYLDQAHRAGALGAHSAAVAMYRGALEHLLFEQGYKTGMLGQKLDALRNDIQNGKAPRWALDLDSEHLSVLNRLGNGAIHPNDGDIAKQAVFDGGLVAQVKETFLELLEAAYELTARRSARLESLKTAAATVSPPRRAKKGK
jgi:hypothetical protein